MKTIPHLRLVVPLLTILCASTAQAQKTDGGPATDVRINIEGRMRAALDRFVESEGIPGMSGAIITPDGTVHAVARGLARLDPPQQMTPDARMCSGSIGKTYCAVVLMQLVAEGRLTLNDPVAEYLGHFDWYERLPNAESLTVRSVANHTSGLRDHVWFPEFAQQLRAEPFRTWKPHELLAFLLDDKPLFEVGQGWSYADSNYIVVGMVIEAIEKRPYEQVLADRVLRPMKLHDTSCNVSPDIPGLVSGYTQLSQMLGIGEEVAVDGLYACNPQFEWTGGGITSTTSDLARFMHGLFTTDIVAPEQREVMLESRDAPRLGPNAQYGIGIATWPTDQGDCWGHSGIFPGYLSKCAYFPDSGITVAVQVNSDRRGASQAMEGAFKALRGCVD